MYVPTQPQPKKIDSAALDLALWLSGAVARRRAHPLAHLGTHMCLSYPILSRPVLSCGPVVVHSTVPVPRGHRDGDGVKRALRRDGVIARVVVASVALHWGGNSHRTAPHRVRALRLAKLGVRVYVGDGKRKEAMRLDRVG